MDTDAEFRNGTIKKITELLHGNNYEIWLKIYGPFQTKVDLETQLKLSISKDVQIFKRIKCDIEQVKSEILSMLLYEGFTGSGPINLKNNNSHITNLIHSLFSSINLDFSEHIEGFSFKKGHPAYPVFWDFAYDIYSNEKRWIFIGCSSD